MRSKKITAVIVIAIVAITTLNVNVMLEDSAIDTFLTLNLSEKLALGEDTGSGANGEKGPMKSSRVHCTSTTTTTTETTRDYWADKVMCQGASGNCTSYDPC